MSEKQSKASLKTRSAAECSSSTSSSQRKRAQLSQLKAMKAQRAAEDVERALEIRRKAAAAAASAEAEAQLALQQSRAEARKAADAAELDALELLLIEEDELSSQSMELLAGRREPGKRTKLLRLARLPKP